MSAVTTWSLSASDNNAAPPNGFPEGQAAASLNNCMRQLMSDVAREFQVNAVKVLASVAGTNTITGSMSPDLASYSAGMMVVLIPANNNTDATTLNIDSLGALDVQKGNAQALVSGDLVAGIPAVLVLDTGSDDWILLNPQTHSGSASLTTLTVTGALTLNGALTTDNSTADEVGFKGLPRNQQSGDYTFVLSDAGKMIQHTSASAHAWTVPPASSVAFPIGTVLTLANGNGGGAITITQGSGVTIYLAGTSSTSGNRTLTSIGVATLMLTSNDVWIASGTGLS